MIYSCFLLPTSAMLWQASIQVQVPPCDWCPAFQLLVLLVRQCLGTCRGRSAKKNCKPVFILANNLGHKFLILSIQRSGAPRDSFRRRGSFSERAHVRLSRPLNYTAVSLKKGIQLPLPLALCFRRP